LNAFWQNLVSEGCGLKSAVLPMMMMIADIKQIISRNDEDRRYTSLIHFLTSFCSGEMLAYLIGVCKEMLASIQFRTLYPTCLVGRRGQ
jgi:hypothetical protein